MIKRKKLQELTFKDNFMFGAVMLNPVNCKGVLERILGIEIERVEVDREKSMIYSPERKSIRIDIYAKGETNKRYTAEMQVRRVKSLEKRSRYYHSQMDMDILEKGENYENLLDTYVIFICDYDPFGKGKYCYTEEKAFRKCPESKIDDGAYTIYLNTRGGNDKEVSEELVRFLKFVAADLPESEQDFDDELIEQLQKSVQEVKESREMGAKYMTMKEYVRIEYYWDYMLAAKRLLDKGVSMEDVCDALELDREDVEEALIEIEKKGEEFFREES